MYSILLNADIIKTHKTGIENYIYNLVRGFIEVTSESEYEYELSILMRSKRILQNLFSDFKIRRAYYIDRIFNKLMIYDRAKAFKVEGAFLNVIIDKEHDIYHEPGHILLDIKSRYKVLTIHDLATLYVPQYHPINRVMFFKERLRDGVERADIVIAVSKFTKQTVMELLGVPSNKIMVVYNGIDGTRFRIYSDKEVGEVLNRLDLPKNYVLTVGTIEPRKNLIGLIDAHDRLPRFVRKEFPLVVVGRLGWNYEEILDKIRKKENEKELIYLGYMDDNMLPFLYSGAAIFVYLSFFEGFGLPVLEAMASGTPVIASNTTSIPEIVDTAGLLVDPRDNDEIVEALLSLIYNENLRERYRMLGLKRANKFSWRKTAKETLDVYYKLLNS